MTLSRQRVYRDTKITIVERCMSSRIKNSCSIKYIVQGMKRQATHWEQVFAKGKYKKGQQKVS